MIADDFPPAFAVDGVVKDLGIIRARTGGTGVPPALIDVALGLYRAVADQSRGAQDMSAVIGAFDGADA